MGLMGIAALVGSSALVGAVIGGTVSGVVEHWLGTEPRDPNVKWRVGPRRVMAELKTERLADDNARRVRRARRAAPTHDGGA
jgi:hypothetical protein